MAANWRDFEVDEIPEWSVSAQNMLLSLVIIVLVLIAFFSFILPLNNEINIEKQKETANKNQFRLKAQQVAVLPNVDFQVQKLQDFYRKLSKQLPEENELAQLVAGINDTGLQYNLNFNQISWLSEKKTGFLLEVPLDIELEGRYQDIGLFSAALAKLPRIVALQDFTLERVEGEHELLQFAVTAYIYRYVESEGQKL